MKGHILKIIIILVVLALNISCDRVTKGIAQKRLKGRGTVQIVGNIFIFRYTENTGAFMSIGSKLPPKVRFYLLALFPTIVLIGLIGWILISKDLSKIQTIALATIVGGGIGNIFDRLFHQGRVVDFMNLGIGRVRTGIFNIADLSIIFGGLLFLIVSFAGRKYG
jgi:signal peptidase II